MTVIERVARAICTSRGSRDADAADGGPHPSGTWLDIGEPWWTGDRDAARAAINALRLKPFSEELFFEPELYEKLRRTYGSFFNAYEFGETFNKLIDHILSEDETGK